MSSVKNGWLNQILDAWLATSPTVKVQFVTSAFVDSPSVVNLSDVSGGDRLGTPTALTSLSASGKVLYSGEKLCASGTAGSTIAGYVIFVDTGDESTSQIVEFIDRDDSGLTISLPTGGDIDMAWPDGLASI